MDFVTLSYIRTSDEGVQINILYEKNIDCHFVFFHHMHLLYHNLDILISAAGNTHASLKLIIDQSLLKHSFCGSNQILINVDVITFRVKEGRKINQGFKK